MKTDSKLILFLVFLFISVGIFGQKPKTTAPKSSGVKVKNYEEAKAKEESKKWAAEARRREEIEVMLGEQVKYNAMNSMHSQSQAASVHSKAESFYTAAMARISKKHVTWIKENSRKIYEKKLDDLSIEMIAIQYGKEQELGQIETEGLLLLLFKETYEIGKKEYRDSYKQISVNSTRKSSLISAQKMLADSSREITQLQLDSINLLLDNPAVSKKENSFKQPESNKGFEPENSSRKMTERSVSDLSLTKTKLAEKIKDLDYNNDKQTLRMNEIVSSQQKITNRLSIMVNHVKEAEEKIIQKLQ